MPTPPNTAHLDPWTREAEEHRREAARLRALAASTTTATVRRQLEEMAQMHEVLVGERKVARRR